MRTAIALALSLSLFAFAGCKKKDEGGKATDKAGETAANPDEA